MVGNEEIKLEMFADDLTTFLRDHASLDTLLRGPAPKKRPMISG